MQYLHLYAHVKFVAGQQQGALYDLQGGKVQAAPLVLENILNAFRQKPMPEVLKECFGANASLFNRYVDFLLKGNWAFITTRPAHFPTASLAWESPYKINTAIVAHDTRNCYDLPAALQQLSQVGCRHLELQLHNYMISDNTEDDWRQITDALQQTEFRRGTLVLSRDQTEVIDHLTVENLLKNWPRFGTVVILGQEENQTLEINGRKYYLRKAKTLADYAAKTWQLHQQTHFVGPAYFREAQIANPYFNRRLAIDSNGNFKNDLLYGGQENFGKIGKRSIAAVITDPEFQKRWFAGPDKIKDVVDNPLRYCLRYDRPIKANSDVAESWSFSEA